MGFFDSFKADVSHFVQNTDDVKSWNKNNLSKKNLLELYIMKGIVNRFCLTKIKF